MYELILSFLARRFQHDFGHVKRFLSLQMNIANLGHYLLKALKSPASQERLLFSPRDPEVVQASPARQKLFKSDQLLFLCHQNWCNIKLDKRSYSRLLERAIADCITWVSEWIRSLPIGVSFRGCSSGSTSSLNNKAQLEWNRTPGWPLRTVIQNKAIQLKLVLPNWFRSKKDLTRTSRDGVWHVFGEHRKDKYRFGAQVCQLLRGYRNDSTMRNMISPRYTIGRTRVFTVKLFEENILFIKSHVKKRGNYWITGRMI